MAIVVDTLRAVKTTVRKTVKRGGEETTRERTREVKTRTRTLADKLKFGRGNAKLDAAIFTFSLPAGWSCPGASECLSKADAETGRVRDGGNTRFRCYAASMEARHRTVRDARWHNFDLLRGKTRDEMVALILDSLSPYAGFVRVHDSGDFHSQDAFDAWLEVARRRPGTTFYAYTKSLPFWAARLVGIPDNLVLTASRGGKYDRLINLHGLRYAEVVLSEQEAEEKGLDIDHDDSHAMRPGPSFALMIHGTQPPGSAASKAITACGPRASSATANWPTGAGWRCRWRDESGTRAGGVAHPPGQSLGGHHGDETRQHVADAARARRELHAARAAVDALRLARGDAERLDPALARRPLGVRAGADDGRPWGRAVEDRPLAPRFFVEGASWRQATDGLTGLNVVYAPDAGDSGLRLTLPWRLEW